MSSFAPASIKTTTAKPDPTKHVNYTLGMVLGVDDFTQEFAYLSGRDQWLARDLIGYGTANGLEVKIQGLEVIVQPGVALSPAGQLIRVPATQCARLDQWAALDKNKSQLPQNGMANLYVVLCYRECQTDLAPIPGEPCRSEEDTMQPSRLADDFKLELRFTPPEQCEEDALREFVEWLHASLDITDAGTDFISLEDFLSALREAADQVTSPPCSSPFMLLDSLPLGLRVHTEDVCEYLRAAFRLWVTELRPRWKSDYMSRWQGCAGQTSSEASHLEDCLLLAELRVPFAGGAINFADVEVNEDRRPYLLHLRMLQEWVICGKAARAAMALDDLTDVTVPAPQEGQALVFHNNEWVAETLKDVPPGGPAGGDLSGTYPDPKVDGILGYPINPPPSADNQVLVFKNADSKHWESRQLLLDDLKNVAVNEPHGGEVLTFKKEDGEEEGKWIAAPASGGSSSTATLMLPFVTITQIAKDAFELWFHLDAPNNQVEIQEQNPNDRITPVEVLREDNSPTEFLFSLAIRNLSDRANRIPPRRNVFSVKNIDGTEAGELLRFRFDTSLIQLSRPSRTTLLKYIEKTGVRFMGSAPNEKVITAFFRVPSDSQNFIRPITPIREEKPPTASRKASRKGKTK